MLLRTANSAGSGLRLLTREISPAARSEATRTGWVTPLLWVAGAGVLAAVLALHGRDFATALDRALQANWPLVAVGALFEAGSIGGYVVLLHRVVSGASPRLRLKDSYDIALAGTAATRLLPTAGLGGVAVTVWALRAHGIRPQELGERVLAFLLLLYAVYMAGLVTCGGAVALGLVHVGRGRALGLVGAVIGLAVALAVLGLVAAPALLGGVLGRIGQGSGRLAWAARRAEEQLPVLRCAMRRSWLELRRPHPALLGALAWWSFDIAVLFTTLHAFGVTLALPALVLAYFLGTMLNVLPLPGSLSGGLVGALLALGAPVGATIAAVLAYRTVAVRLPAASGLASIGALRSSVAGWRAEAQAASPG
ncbi:MAG: lysylphosphatidylglycerol synthase transmembrane domain-containing protein [Solirubrobacteraceae bacterium]